MRKLTSNEIKQEELYLLKEFVKICEDNNLYYVLCGGTLLGAIRHKGFIPWDDDIDILMPRPDFERLINKTNIDFSRLPSNLEIVSWKDGTFEYPFMKLVNKDTKVINPYISDAFGANNVWIDIFPIDGNPEDEEELKALYKKSIKYRKICTLLSARVGAGKSTFKKIFKPLLIKFYKTIYTVPGICKKIDEICKTYDFDACESIGGVCWGYGPQERINKEKFMIPIQVKFEDAYFNAPSNYVEYLTNLYGDYMKLPPVEKRVNHEITVFKKEIE